MIPLFIYTALAKKSGNVLHSLLPDLYPDGATITDNDERKIYIFGHELAHVEDAAYLRPKLFQERTENQKIIDNAVKEMGSLNATRTEEVQRVQAILETQRLTIERYADKRGFGIVESYRQNDR